MTKSQEKLLVAVLCGLLLTSAAFYAVGPANAAEGYEVYRPADVIGLTDPGLLNVHEEPTSGSQAIGALPSFATVWIERCVEVPDSSDWCKIYWGPEIGWVDARHLLVQ